MERSNEEERTESKCRKDKDYDLRYGTGPPAEFRRVSMPHWSETLTTDIHGARELHAPWMADHRRKSRSDLTSLR